MTEKSSSSKKDWPLLIVALSLIVVYLVIAWILPHGVFVTVDEGGKLLYIQNVLRTGSPAAPFIYPARAIDPSATFFPTYWHIREGDQILTWWQIGFPLLTLPLYAMLGWMGLFIIPALSGGAIALLSGLIFEMEFPDRRKWTPWMAALLGLATPIAFYSANFHEHTLSIALALAGVYFILRALRDGRNREWLLAALCASLATFFRTELGVLFVGMGIYLLVKYWRGAIRFGIFFVACCLPWMLLNQLVLGYPINHHLGAIAGSGTFAGVGANALKTLPMILFGQSGPVDAALPPTNSYLLMCSALLLLGFALLFFRRTRGWAGIAFVGLAGAISYWVLISPVQYTAVHGFLEIAPFVACALGIAGNWQFFRRSSLVGLVAAGGLVFLAVYIAKAWTSAGGLQWGPRYLMSFYPLLGILAVGFFLQLFEEIRGVQRWVWCAGLAACVLVAVGFQARGIWTWANYLNRYKAAAQVIFPYTDLPVVTEYCDPPLHVADIYWDQQFVSITRTGMAAWEENARQQGVDAYYVAQMDVCQTVPLDRMAAPGSEVPSGVTITRVELPE